jgi:hypothetical protein
MKVMATNALNCGKQIRSLVAFSRFFLLFHTNDGIVFLTNSAKTTV